MVTDNQVTRTEPVKIERPEEVIEPFTADEARRIIAAAWPGSERRVVTVALGGGLRPKTFGLKRGKIDLNANNSVDDLIYSTTLCRESEPSGIPVHGGRNGRDRITSSGITLPEAGQLVRVRSRQFVVDDVVLPEELLG